MEDTGVVGGPRKQTTGDDTSLKACDRHIRSATTLGYILWKTRDYTIGHGTNREEGETNRLVSLLNNLADRIEAANGNAVGDAQRTPKFDNALYAKNSLNADGDVNPITSMPANITAWNNFVNSGLDQGAIIKAIYQLRSYVPKKSSKDSQDCLNNLHPQFHNHAQMVFDLFQAFLKQRSALPQDKSASRPARTAFQYYVLGMGLEKLSHKVEDREWATDTYEKGFRDFLEGKTDESQFHALEKPPRWSGNVKIRFLQIAKNTECLHLKYTTLKRKIAANGNFDIDLARVVHEIMRFRFRRIVQSLAELQKLPPSESPPTDEQIDKFTKSFENLHYFLFTLHSFVEICDDLFSLYCEAINAPKKKSCSSDPEKPGMTIIDNLWHKSYTSWIRDIVRQARSAGRLISLQPHYRRSVMKLQFESIQTDKPSEEMEDWEMTINKIYGRNTESNTARWNDAQLVKMYLTRLSRQPPKLESLYVRLRDWKFGGAIHCEATIACKNITKPTKDSRAFIAGIGVSKQCCVVCSYILQEVTKHLESPSSARLHVDFRGESKKIWPCALPKDCPLSVAQRVSERFDELLLGIFTQCLPSLREKFASIARSSTSPVSVDENGPDKDESDYELPNSDASSDAELDSNVGSDSLSNTGEVFGVMDST